MGIAVRARRTIIRSGIEILPGTVFEMPDQKSADHLIEKGVVTPYLNQPIAATPEYEVTETGAKREVLPVLPEGPMAPVSLLDKPPESFIDEGAPSADRPKGKRR